MKRLPKNHQKPNFCQKYTNFQLFETFLQDKLPSEDIAVPITELPDPENDNGSTGESMKEQENKWTDLGLNQLSESTSNERQWKIYSDLRTIRQERPDGNKRYLTLCY